MLPALLLLTVLGWGSAAYLNSVNAKENSPLHMVFWRPFTLLPVLLLALLFGAELRPPPQLLLLCLASSTALLLAVAFYYSALRHGVSSEVVAVYSSFPLAALAGLVIFWGERPGMPTLIGALAVVGGVSILQIKKSEGHPRISVRPLFLGLSAALCLGAWSLLDWQALSYGSAWDLVLWNLLFALLLQIPVLIWARRSGRSIRPAGNTLGLIAGAGYLNQTAITAYYFALGSGSPAVVISISAAFPLVTQWILILKGREEPSLRRLFGTAIIVAGVAVIQVT